MGGGGGGDNTPGFINSTLFKTRNLSFLCTNWAAKLFHASAFCARMCVCVCVCVCVCDVEEHDLLKIEHTSVLTHIRLNANTVLQCLHREVIVTHLGGSVAQTEPHPILQRVMQHISR